MLFAPGRGLAATNCINAFSRGYDRLRNIKPAFVGDAIYMPGTNLVKNPKYAGMRLNRAFREMFKGEGELVLYCEHPQTAKYRKPGDYADQVERKTEQKAP